MPATLENYAREVFFQGPNPHALHLDFQAGGTIYKGAPVTLDPVTGNALPADATTIIDQIIGYALNPAVDGERVTVIANGKFVVNGIAEAAGVTALDTVGFDSYTDPNLVYATTATANLVVGIALNTAAAGAALQVLVR